MLFTEERHAAGCYGARFGSFVHINRLLKITDGF